MKLRLLLLFGLALAAFAVAPAAFAAEPSVGECLSATETSLRLRASHKLREERAQLLICSAETCPAEVRQECLHRMSDVNAAEPTVVFTVKSAAGQELSSVKITMDGDVVVQRLDGGALSLDPGSHQFLFEAPGHAPMTETIILHEGEKDRREIVIVEPDASGPVAPSETRDRHGQRVFGLAVGIGGLVALAAGGITGGMALSAWQTAKGECPSYKECTAHAIHERDTASTLATVSTVGFVAGGVLAAGGLTLYLTAPKEKSPSVGIQVLAPLGLAVTGRF